MGAFVKEQSRETEVYGEYDVVVCGGGIAGIAAALAAARSGVKTALVENGYMLGGLATAGLIAVYLPLCDGMGNQLSFGIAEELLRLSVLHGGENSEQKFATGWLKEGTAEDRKKYRFEVQYNPHVFAILAEQLLLKEGVDILYGGMLTGVERHGDKIAKITVSTRTANLTYSAKSFVDCTGDAVLCDYAGEKTALSEMGNALAAWYYETIDGEYTLRMHGSCDYVYAEGGAKNAFVGLDARELSDVTVRSHESLLQDFLKKGGVSKAHGLSTIASIPQVRMTRRLCGVAEMEKLDDKKRFEDSVGLFGSWLESGYAFELPIGTLYGERVKNLTVAGRCISVKGNDMWDITRVIPVCAQTGEAAGLIAALYQNTDEIDVQRVQGILSERGVKLHLDEVYK